MVLRRLVASRCTRPCLVGVGMGGELGGNGESPVKAVARVRRAGGEAKGFRPLFGSPVAHRVQNVPPSTGEREMEDDEDALMDDPTSPIGGLFAAQVEQRRLRRARESQSPMAIDDKGAVKKHKVRTVHLPSGDSDDELINNPSSSSLCHSSSPPTDLTVPSSALRPSKNLAPRSASSPLRKPIRSLAHRTIQTLQLSDDEAEPKTISITPYQRYGTLHSATTAADEDEEDLSYAIPSTLSITNTSTDNASDSDDESNQPSLAGLKLSPVRHARSDRLQRNRLLTSIFEPQRKSATIFNPEPRCGPLQPQQSQDTDDESSTPNTGRAQLDSDDDDDWQQEVDQDFTFWDSEIELNDVA